MTHPPDMPTVTVRGAAADDATAVALLLEELGYPTSPAEAARRLAELHHSEVDHVLVAEMDGEPGTGAPYLRSLRSLTGAPVGLVSLNIAPLLAEGGYLARITALAVRAQHRGNGIGRELVAAAERLAAQAGCRIMQVSSGRRPERDAAHRFYPRLGYDDAGRHHTLYEKQLPGIVDGP